MAMWGRRTTRTGDAAEAARRRLAVIAAEFDRRPAAPALGSPPTSSPSLRTPLELDPAGSEGDQPRHRAPVFERGRRRLTTQHLAVVVLAIVALLALAVWWALRAVPHSQAVPLATTLSPGVSTAASEHDPSDSGTPPSTTPRGGVPDPTTAGSTLVVDVAGKVRRPGIVELPLGSRVIDALTAAGGPRPGVDTAGLNLARLLLDGEQIVVGLDVPAAPAAGPPPLAGSSPTAPAVVDLNTADQAQLETLPGIGPVTAQAILEWRSDNGSFSSVEQLLDVSGIGDATLADIEPYVRV